MDLETIIGKCMKPYVDSFSTVLLKPLCHLKTEVLANSTQDLKLVVERLDRESRMTARVKAKSKGTGEQTLSSYATKVRHRHIGALSWLVGDLELESIKDIKDLQAFGNQQLTVDKSSKAFELPLWVLEKLSELPSCFDSVPVISILLWLVLSVLRDTDATEVEHMFHTLPFAGSVYVTEVISRSFKLAFFFQDNVADHGDVDGEKRINNGWQKMVSMDGVLVAPPDEEAFYAPYEVEWIKDLRKICLDGGKSFLTIIISYLQIGTNCVRNNQSGKIAAYFCYEDAGLKKIRCPSLQMELLKFYKVLKIARVRLLEKTQFLSTSKALKDILGHLVRDIFKLQLILHERGKLFVDVEKSIWLDLPKKRRAPSDVTKDASTVSSTTFEESDSY